MDVLKALFKLALLLVLGAALAGVVVLVKRPKTTATASFDEWPDIARNPAA